MLNSHPASWQTKPYIICAATLGFMQLPKPICNATKVSGRSSVRAAGDALADKNQKAIRRQRRFRHREHVPPNFHVFKLNIKQNNNLTKINRPLAEHTTNR
jgi:hypothetical protein